MNRMMLSAMLAACTALAVPAHAADVAAGKAKAEDSCVDCHGDDGKGDDDSPAIGGMSVDKFTKAIQEYQNGTRTKNARWPKRRRS